MYGGCFFFLQTSLSFATLINDISASSRNFSRKFVCRKKNPNAFGGGGGGKCCSARRDGDGGPNNNVCGGWQAEWLR